MFKSTLENTLKNVACSLGTFPLLKTEATFYNHLLKQYIINVVPDSSYYITFPWPPDFLFNMS